LCEWGYVKITKLKNRQKLDILDKTNCKILKKNRRSKSVKMAYCAMLKVKKGGHRGGKGDFLGGGAK